MRENEQKQNNSPSCRFVLFLKLMWQGIKKCVLLWRFLQQQQKCPTFLLFNFCPVIASPSINPRFSNSTLPLGAFEIKDTETMHMFSFYEQAKLWKYNKYKYKYNKI